MDVLNKTEPFEGAPDVSRPLMGSSNRSRWATRYADVPTIIWFVTNETNSCASGESSTQDDFGMGFASRDVPRQMKTGW